MERPISFRVILIAGLIAQILCIPLLWGHTSDAADVFGRYSTRYALGLALNVALIIGYAGAVVFAGGLRAWAERLPRLARWGLWVTAIGTLVAVWQASLAVQLTDYLGLNVILLIALTAYPLMQKPATCCCWQWVLAGLMVVSLVPLFLTALTVQGYHPDEAHYADFASTFMAEGMLYDSTWLTTPSRIQPGSPWMIAAYGWLLEQIGYTVYVGRVINFAAYLLCFGGLYAVGARLYRRDVGLIVAGTAFLSVAFIPEWDYSPNHLLTTVGAWTLYLWVVAQGSDRPRVKYGLLALVGLVVTLSLNVHAAGVVFAAAYSMWAAWNVAWVLWQREPLRPALLGAVAFGVGALVGTGLYYLTNIAPVGGIGSYLGVLAERYGAPRPVLFFYQWESLTERVLILAAVIWLAWRRTSADRTVLTVVGFTVLAAFVIDTEGYIWHFGPLYFLALAAFLGEAFRGQAFQTVLVTVVSAVMAVQVGWGFVDWGTVRQYTTTGTVPTYLYNDLKAVVPPYVRPDDIIYTTHQLIWLFPQTSQPDIISYAAERRGMERFGLDEPVQVWERVEPNVIIFVEGQMSFDPGMQAYMTRHPFEVCDTVTVQNTPITIYRRDCDNILN